MSSNDISQYLKFLLGFLLLIFSSCGREDKKISEEVSLYNAKHEDIPIPVGYKLVDAKVSRNKGIVIPKYLVYEGNLSLKDTINFYKCNVERLGWDIENLSNEKEGLFFCKKRNRECAISIRKSTRKGLIFLFFSPDGKI